MDQKIINELKTTKNYLELIKDGREVTSWVLQLEPDEFKAP